MIANSAYASEELAEKAADKSIELITTGLCDRKSFEILTQFKLSVDGHAVTECPEWHMPKSCSYIRQTNYIRVSFPLCCYENYPHQKECNVKIKAFTPVLIFLLGS